MLGVFGLVVQKNLRGSDRMYKKRLNYDQNGNYTGYSTKEPQFALKIDYTNMPAIVFDQAAGMFAGCFIIDFISFLTPLGSGVLGVGTCLISIVVLLIMIAVVIDYLIKPVKTGEKWINESVIVLVMLLLNLAIHIIIICL